MTGDRAAWRLLVHPPADGAWNMAVDEAILDMYAGDGAPATPTFRIYGWSPPTLSLGRFQAARGAHDAAFLRENGIDLVRRPTGGSAVLHEFERTYAVVARLRCGPFPGSVLDTYRRLATALCAGLRRLGLEAVAEDSGKPTAERRLDAACFGVASTHEITVGGLKLVGSAQLRRRGAFLQHGSILLRSDPRRLARAIGLGEPPGGYTDLVRELGDRPPEAALDRALISAFEGEFAAPLVRGSLTERETERATFLRAWKYHAASWTHDGRPDRD